MSGNSLAIKKFRTTVWRYYRAHGRHDLPWRHTHDPYRILVSEVMLQQTQVPRVIEKYKEFLKAFPTIRALAQVSLADVLKVWSGMGYNRRAKYLREAAITIVGQYGGRVPRTTSALRAIPGIGPYTASAVRVFAFNIPDTMIETNIRAAFIHHFSKHIYSSKNPNWEKRRSAVMKITDVDIQSFIERAAQGQAPREWHWALMDYGSHIKKLHGNPARKSAHYAKQSRFEGSLRQVRGAILRELHKGSFSDHVLSERLNLPLLKMREALVGLARDGLIIKQKAKWRIS